MVQNNRYSRNLAVKNFTAEMQERLKNSAVLVIGAGGLGSPLLSYLVAAGIGKIGVVEFDTVNITNLQRQILYCEKDLCKNKGEIAIERLKEKNSTCDITLYNEKFTKENGIAIAKGYDLIADCSDNYDARYAMDRVSKELGIPFVYASAEQMGGQISIFNFNGAGSYEDLFPEPPTKDDNIIGVLSPIPGIIGSMQGLEIIKLLSGFGENLCGKLLLYNAKDYSVNVFEV